MYRKTFTISTNHTVLVRSVEKTDLPDHLEDSDDFTKFYVVQNFDENGPVFLYLGKGFDVAPDEICAWYPNSGSMWCSFGTNIKDAVEGAIKDAWLYA